MDVGHAENKEVAILSHAIENTNEAFVTIDKNHKVLFFNKAAEKIFGYSREEVLGHDLDVIMSPGCSRDHRSAVARYVKTRIPRNIGHARELLATRKNGEIFPASISFSVSEALEDVYFTGIVRDLTETKALQERISKSERLAALGQVVAEITHEIKNPLMMIGGFARQLIRETKDEKSQKKLNIIWKEVSRLENLLQELRDYYSPGFLGTEKVDINKLLHGIHALVREDCRKSNIRVRVKVDPDPVIIETDQNKLKQVLLNLTKNAIEAMESGGNLTLQSRLRGDEVEIAVKDEGSGISKENQEKIFSPFFTTKTHGTGLGLSISKSIIEDQGGGSLTLDSEKGRGTTVRVNMPVGREEKKSSSETEHRK